MAKKNVTTKGVTNKRKGKLSSKRQIVFIFIVSVAVVFLPTTIILIIGLLPSFVSVFVDKSKKKITPITVGALNLAGCSPFLFELWVQGNTVGDAMRIIADPMSVVVMYSAAAVGYLLDWAVTGMISGFLYQKGIVRQDVIVNRQNELVSRWGKEVTGAIRLDEYGFAVEKER
ncbi:MAG: hypothetical protein KAJ86_00290 [Alphaproteobacteria bacterium]|nr:hypothetical protein [Alphaproteobacteria bacterium]